MHVLLAAMLLVAPGAPGRPGANYLARLQAAAAKGPAAKEPAAKGPAVKGPVAVVTFQGAAEARDAVIRLGDIAVIEAADPEMVSRLEALEVGSAPLPGRSRMVSADYARIRIRQLGLDPGAIQFAGVSLATVTTPDQTVPGAEIEKIACEAAEAANPGIAAEAVSTPPDLRLRRGAVELKPQGGRALTGTFGSVVVQVLVDGRQEAAVTVGFRVMRRAPTLVAVRDLMIGTVITPQDVRVEERPVVPGPLVLSDPAVVIGQQVSVPIKGGRPLTAAMVKAPVLFKRGERIRLICRGRGFTVMASGEAMQDGVAGQPVRVRNLSSLLELTGRVVGNQSVEVPF